MDIKILVLRCTLVSNEKARGSVRCASKNISSGISANLLFSHLLLLDPQDLILLLRNFSKAVREHVYQLGQRLLLNFIQ